MNTKIIIIIVAITVLLAGGLYIWVTNTMQESDLSKDTPAVIEEEKQTLKGSPVEQIVPPLPAEEEPPPEIDVAGWLTYRNEGYGFEFIHPKDYMISKNALGTIEIRDSESEKLGNIAIDFKGKFGDLSLLEFAKQRPTPKDKIKSQTELLVKIAGLEVVRQDIKFTQQDEIVRDSTVYYFEDPEIYIIIRFYITDDQVVAEKIRQIISTFKFVEPEVELELEVVSIEDILQNDDFNINDFSQTTSFDFTDTIYESQRIFYKFFAGAGQSVSVDFESEATLYVYRSPDFLRAQFGTKTFVSPEAGEFYLEIERTGLPTGSSMDMETMEQSEYSLSVSFE